MEKSVLHRVYVSQTVVKGYSLLLSKDNFSQIAILPQTMGDIAKICS